MKLALCLGPADVAPKARVAAMTRAQQLHRIHHPRHASFPHGCLGLVSGAERHSPTEYFRQHPAGNWLAITGLPISKGAPLAHRLDHALAANDTEAAARTLAQLDGSFAIILYHRREQALIIVTDPLGLAPLYLAQTPNALLLATDTRALAASGLIKPALDDVGFAALLSFGHMLGHRSLLAGVTRIDGGTVTRIDANTHRIHTTEHWRWPAPQHNITIDNADTGELLDILRQDVQAYLQHVNPGLMLLSGGFDSRLIAALLHERSITPDALVLLNRRELNGIDGLLGIRVAQALGLRYDTRTLPTTYYASHDYLRYLIMSEVETTSYHLFIAQVAATLDWAMAGVWDGVCAGPALAPHQPPGGFDAYLAAECAGYDAVTWRAARRLFGEKRVRDMHHAFHNHLAQLRQHYDDDAPESVTAFIADNRLRMRTGVNPFKVYANTVLPLAPGSSRDFWHATARIPYHVKADQRLYMKLYRQHLPRLADIPFCSAGRLYGPCSRWPHRVDAARKQLLHNFPARATQRALARARTGYWRPERALIAQVLGRIDPDTVADEINPDTVRSLQRSANRFYAGEDQPAQTLLFYYQIWRWLMHNQLNPDANLPEPQPTTVT